MLCPRCKNMVPDDALSCPHCSEILSSTLKLSKPPLDPFLPEPPETPAGSDLTKGALLNHRYEIMLPLGEGGMGKVYLAWDREICEHRAIKVLPPQTAHDLLAITRLKEEARLAMSLAHPNIVRLYNYERVGGIHYLVMEYVNGLDLRTYLTVKGRLAEDEVRRIALEIAFALKASHTMKIIHRDIKPANILLEWKALDIEKIKKKGMDLSARDVPDLRGARVRLMDFGIAQPIKESLSRSSLSLGDTSGTLTYMSPEQVKGKGIDHSCDLYALGVTMYELLRGQPPFSGDALVYQILNEVPEEIPGLSPHLQTIILKLLEKDKAKRIPTAEILIRELKGPETGLAPADRPPMATRVRPWTGAWEQAGKKQALEIFERIKTRFSKLSLQPVFEKARSLKRRNNTVLALALAVFLLLLLVILLAAGRESGMLRGWASYTNSRLWQGLKPPSQTDSITGMEFILVKGGCFPRGDIFSAGNADETPARTVCLKPFYLGKYEVTQDQWLKIMGRNPAWFLAGGAYPVERVSWEDVQGFLARFNQRSGKTYRLPTEAEWEFAARGKGSSDLYAGSRNGAEIGEAAWYVENSNGATHPVGQKRPNPLGFHDLSGNVWEWVSDWYQEDYYRQSPKYNPAGPARGTFRVLRGGSVEFAPWYLRTTVRGRDVPGRRYGNIGFRLARD